MIPELILIALLIGWLTGGKFWRLADAKIRHVWLIFVPLGLYLVSWAPPFVKMPFFLGASAIIEKLALIMVALFNLRLPGVKLILIGLLLNTVALSVNGGMMPASENALRAAFGSNYVDKARDAVHVRSAIMDASTELAFLCDIIAAKRPFVLLPAVYSIGDLAMSVGIFITIIAIMRTPLPSEKKPDAGEGVGNAT
ncbi:MAG: DUF5317 domain-containing protein [Armatimonadetes bacterium]|nr:DUF5317 domain-containing protein [Armatimonadota bacterium]